MNNITRLFNFNNLPPSEGLIAAWNLSDVNDNFSTNHLTNNNVATFVAGKITNAVNLDGVNQYLSIVDNVALSGGAGFRFSFVCWFFLDVLPSAGNIRPILSKWNTNNQEYRIYITETGAIKFGVSDTGANETVVTSVTIIRVNRWYYVCCWMDGDNINIELDNSGVIAQTAFGLNIFNGTAEFQIGKQQSLANFFDGKIDAVRVYKSTMHNITTAERAALFNNGQGREYVLSNIVSSDEVNRELDQIINLLSGKITDITPMLVGTLTDAMLTINQNGIGPIAQFWNSVGGLEKLKIEILNTGQIKFYEPDSLNIFGVNNTLIENLNADKLDGKHANQYLQTSSYQLFCDSVFFDGTVVAGQKQYTYLPQNNLIEIKVKQNGVSSANASTTFTIKEDAQLETIIATITITGVNTAVQSFDITDYVPVVDRIFVEVTVASGDTKHNDVNISFITRELPFA